MSDQSRLNTGMCFNQFPPPTKSYCIRQLTHNKIGGLTCDVCMRNSVHDVNFWIGISLLFIYNVPTLMMLMVWCLDKAKCKITKGHSEKTLPKYLEYLFKSRKKNVIILL